MSKSHKADLNNKESDDVNREPLDFRSTLNEREVNANLRHAKGIYMLVGGPEKAIDQVELLKIPYYLSPRWLAIDPNFDPLRRNPRFWKLVAGGKRSATDIARR